jgi:hypothetical protein
MYKRSFFFFFTKKACSAFITILGNFKFHFKTEKTFLNHSCTKIECFLRKQEEQMRQQILFSKRKMDADLRQQTPHQLFGLI